MNPENKKFVLAMIDKFMVTTSPSDMSVMYAIILPDGKPLIISADTTDLRDGNTEINYTISIDEDLLEEVTISTKDKVINPIARDIIEIMRKCNLKVMAQEAYLIHSKFMIPNLQITKQYS